MKKINKFFGIIVAVIIFNMSGSAQNWAWVATAGQSNQSNMSDSHKNMVKFIGMDNEGYIYTSGSFRDYIQLGSDFLTTIVYPNCNGCYDVFVAKMDSLGNYVWAKQLRGDNDLIYGMGVTQEGDVFLAGAFGGSGIKTVDFGNGITLTATEFDIWYAKYDSDGVIQWAKKIGGSSVDFGCSLTLDESENIYISGYYNGTVNFGNYTLISENNDDMFLAKADNNGNILWAISETGVSREAGYSIDVDENENIYVHCAIDGDATIGGNPIILYGSKGNLIVKYDNNGNFIWVTETSSAEFSWIYDLEIDKHGYINICGYFTNELNIDGTSIYTNAPNGAGFVAKLDTLGNLIYATAVQGTNLSRFKALYPDSEGGIYVGGILRGTINFGPPNGFVPSADINICLFHLDQMYNVDWATQTGKGYGYQLLYDMIVKDTANIIIAGSVIGEGEFGGILYDAGLPLTFDEDIFVALARPLPVGISTDDHHFLDFNIYPNPNNGEFFIDGVVQNSQLYIFDAKGQLVLNKKINSENVAIDLSNCINGIYIVQIQSEKKIGQKRILINK